MLIGRHSHGQRGFSLVELTVVIAIGAILLAIGLPSLTNYLQNSKLRNAAKTLFSSVQLARAEAIRRNLTVDFMLTSTTVSSTMADSATANTGGPNWLVRAVIPSSDPSDPPTYELIEGKSWQEGSGQSADATAAVVILGSASSLQFNGVGGLTSGAGVTFDITSGAGGGCAAADGSGGQMRCQRVVVLPGGQVRLCDPAVPASAVNDPRVCPA